VVSVGATDALGKQALFSNSGPSLQLTAPGYAIKTVGPGGTRVLFSGTSASAPVVSGSIAALLSSNRGLNALQAADLLATYSTDSGPAGPDPDYGRGTVSLDRALRQSAPANKP
jgi:subtilisin family serine protease